MTELYTDKGFFPKLKENVFNLSFLSVGVDFLEKVDKKKR